MRHYLHRWIMVHSAKIYTVLAQLLAFDLYSKFPKYRMNVTLFLYTTILSSLIYLMSKARNQTSCSTLKLRVWELRIQKPFGIIGFPSPVVLARGALSSNFFIGFYSNTSYTPHILHFILHINQNFNLQYLQIQSFSDAIRDWVRDEVLVYTRE